MYEDDDALADFFRDCSVGNQKSLVLDGLVTKFNEAIKKRVEAADVVSTLEEARRYVDADDESDEYAAIEKGWKLRFGGFADEDDSVESALCGYDVYATAANWVFKNSGGY